VTKGIRNLDDKQKNARVVPKHVTCFHEFEHQRDCQACRDELFGEGKMTHLEVCRKCGLTRSAW
jgi:hypothetical protein